MKLQFLLLLAALHAPFADAGQALPLNTQALEASVLKLVRSGTNTQNVPGAIVSMKNLVGEFLLPHLDGMHKDDQDAMRPTDGPFNWTGFDSCVTDHKKYNGDLSALSEAHKTCRANESQLKAVMDNSCGDERDRKTQRYIAECAVFAIRRPIPAALPTTCYKNRGTTNQHESGRLAEYFKGLRDDYIEWHSKCEEATNESNEQNSTCEEDTKNYANKSAECDRAQIELDSAACWQYRQGDCQAYSRCWAQATENYIDLNSSVAAAVAVRKQESAGLQKILCYLDVLNESQSPLSQGIQACDQRDYDTSAFNLNLRFYADRAPQVPSMPSCAGSEVWPQPGTAAYVAQEYDPLPEDAPARECQSVCCQWCNYFECPNDLHFKNASCVKAYTMGACCDVVAWRPTPWVAPACNYSCGQLAVVANRTVPCTDPEGSVFPDAACANYTKPAARKEVCSATGDCAVCAASNCNVTGTYLDGCGNFSSGSCKQCSVSTGRYATGIGGVNQDNCPSAPCVKRAVCKAGQYLHGCGGANPGSCNNCTDSCLAGYYSDGCTGLSPGTCKTCNVTSGYLAITAGSSASDRCDTVAETEATPVSTNFTVTDLTGWDLDKDSNRHQATISGKQLRWVKLTELCKRSDVTPGWMRYTMNTTNGKNYKVAVEAAWLPVFGDGLKGSNMCHGNGTSVLQFQVKGSGNDDPVGANVTSCFDQVKYFDWSTVWFEFAPQEAQVELNFRESKFSCLSVKSVKIYEVDA